MLLCWLGDVFGPRKTLIRIVLWWSFFTALTGSIYPSLGILAFYVLALPPISAASNEKPTWYEASGSP